ncbi:MAG: class I SAM-dependent methyltransferase [Candidatus Hodarchaeota archaeon]
MVEFAKPRPGLSKEECYFYHVCNVPGVGIVGDQWDLRENVDYYLGNIEYSGKTVLDVGTATGYLTFEMEKRGAAIVSFDMSSSEQYAFVPFYNDPMSRGQLIEEWGVALERVKNGYWFCHQHFESSAKVYYGDVYDLPEDLGQFDLVFVGMCLPHFRDPCKALTSITRRSLDLVVITQPYFSDPRPILRLAPEVDTGDFTFARFLWWTMSDTFLIEFMKILGFSLSKIETSVHTCVAYDPPRKVDVGAFVFKGRSGSC